MNRSPWMILVISLIALAGIVILLYPAFQSILTALREEKAVTVFMDEKEELTWEGSAEEDILREACEDYNSILRPVPVESELEDKPDIFDNKTCFAVLRIPRLKMVMPVYLGASSENLERGAAVIGGTSLPIGGESTCSVIAGHRSWSGSIRFRPIEDLEPGDAVFIENRWEILRYRVESVKIIEACDIEAIGAEEGRDLLKLLTCTYPNTHRVLVTCVRDET